MRTNQLVVSALLFASTACAGSLAAPQRPGAVETVHGQVVGVDETSPDSALASNLHITVRSGSKPVSVDLAPRWYLDKHGLHFAPNDAVSIEGTSGENDAFIARRVHKGDADLELRDASGAPLWEKTP